MLKFLIRISLTLGFAYSLSRALIVFRSFPGDIIFLLGYSLAGSIFIAILWAPVWVRNSAIRSLRRLILIPRSGRSEPARANDRLAARPALASTGLTAGFRGRDASSDFTATGVARLAQR